MDGSPSEVARIRGQARDRIVEALKKFIGILSDIILLPTETRGLGPTREIAEAACETGSPHGCEMQKLYNELRETRRRLLELGYPVPRDWLMLHPYRAIEVISVKRVRPSKEERQEYEADSKLRNAILDEMGRPRPRSANKWWFLATGRRNIDREKAVHEDAFAALEELASAPQGQSVGKTGESDERSKASWECLRVIRGDMTSNGFAVLDGKRYRLGGAKDGEFLRLLISKRGKAVKAATIQTQIGDRPDHIVARLHPDLQVLIDKPGRGKVGYCLR